MLAAVERGGSRMRMRMRLRRSDGEDHGFGGGATYGNVYATPVVQHAGRCLRAGREHPLFHCDQPRHLPSYYSFVGAGGWRSHLLEIVCPALRRALLSS